MRPPFRLSSWLEVYPLLNVGTSKVIVDKSQLVSIIDHWDTSSSEYPPENYTPESYQAVLDAYAIAVAVRDDEEATQQTVDDAYFGLLNAISGLEEVPSGDECKYPLDKTDFSDIEEVLGAPVLPVEFLDSSLQRFKIPNGGSAGYYMAAPEGFGLNPENFNQVFPDRGILGQSIVYASKFTIDGEPNNFIVPIRLQLEDETYGYQEVNPVILSYTSDNTLDARNNDGSVRFVLPNEFTLITFYDSSRGDNLYWYTYIPEVGGVIPEEAAVGYDDILAGRQFGFIFAGEAINVDYTVELVTDKDALVDLIGDFDITAATGVTTLETICGQPLDLSPIEPEECIYPLDATQEQLALMGSLPFDFLDACFNKATKEEFRELDSGYDVVALNKEVFDAFISGGDIPESRLVTKGNAFEVKTDWEWINFDSGLLVEYGVEVGLNNLESDKTFSVRVSRSTTGQHRVDVIPNEGGIIYHEINSSLTSMRIGFYLNHGGDIEIVSNVETINGLYEFGASSAVIGMGLQSPHGFQMWELFASGRDLQFTYPEGTRGLDGELVEAPIQEDCSYPFDVAPAELVSIGYNPYPVHDECYNKFSWDGSGIGNYAAAKKEAFEFFVTGTVPDSAKIPLPESTGTAIEYRIKFPSDDDESSFPILNALVFDIASGGTHSGGGILLQQNTSMNRNLFVLGQGEASGSPISVPQEISEITVSVLYKSDGTMDVKTAYGEVLGKTYLLGSFLVLTSAGNTDGEFEAITNAKDLTFTYPVGTVGLDGEPAPNQSHPDPKPTTIGEFIGGGLYAGDINIDGEDYAIIVATSDAGNPSLRWKTSLSITANAGDSRDGWANTNAMIAAGIEAHPAAEHCVNWRGGGHDDWYLGAQEDWTEINKNRDVNNLWSELALPINGRIWLSTQISANNARNMSASSDSLSNNIKTNEYFVRPIRRIKLYIS